MVSDDQILCSECGEPMDTYKRTHGLGKMLLEFCDRKPRFTPLCAVCYIAERESIPREWVLDRKD